ncbi:MAG TPA: DUF1003 domain-containing protein [Candidatus Limnocylindrales bacterium]|nr:DUF1003 domain-containing protein [Candidatus Limnocylindrales bacterium]
MRKENPKEPASGEAPGTAGVLERNVEAILSHREQFERSRSRQERVADSITHFAGSMAFVYLHIVIFGIWIALDLGWFPIAPLDPTFVTIALAASIEAIFLSTFVLISQNRMAALADKRADLGLQVSLLAEHEITRLVELVTEIGKKMHIDASHDPELSELSQTIAPEKVLDTMEQTERERVAASH